MDPACAASCEAPRRRAFSRSSPPFPLPPTPPPTAWGAAGQATVTGGATERRIQLRLHMPPS